MGTQELLKIAHARRLSTSGEALALRLGAELSLREVASAVGVSPSALWRWEKGERTPRGSAAAAWAQLLTELAAERAHGAA